MGEAAEGLPELSSEMHEHIDVMELSDDERADVKKRVQGVMEADIVIVHASDVESRLLGIDVPVERFEDVAVSGQGIDASSLKGSGRGVNESEAWMKLDLATAFRDPKESKNGRKIARVMTTLHNVDDTPVDFSPRNVLIRQVEKAREMGYRFKVSPELEFFIFPKDPAGNPVFDSKTNAEYYVYDPGVVSEMRTEMMMRLRDIGLKVEAGHNEVAENQHEINFAANDALKQADAVMLYKMIVRQVADDFGYFATFMPKPVFGVNGSGAHENLSLVDAETGENRFYDPDMPMELSKIGRFAAGGLLQHARAFTAVTNPVVNSYKRLVPGFEAPTNIAWGPSNRSTLVRVPDVKNGNSMRLEYRAMDPLANPYLAEAVLLGAVLDGVENEIDPGDPIKGDIFEMSPDQKVGLGISALPGDLNEATQAFRESELMREVLGSNLHAMYADMKEAEWKEYIQQVTQWERDRYARM